MSFFQQLFGCCHRPLNTPNIEIQVEVEETSNPNENSQSQNVTNLNQYASLNPKLNNVFQQSSISGLTYDSSLTTVIGKSVSISPQRNNKKNFDCSAIFMPSESLFKYEEPDYIPTKDVIISDEDISKAKIIRLIELEGHLLNQSSLVINPLGIKDHCERKDSISYFWLQPSNDKAKCFKQRDFHISYTNASFESKFFFIIFFIKELNEYKIRINPSYVKSLDQIVFFSIPKSIEIPLNTNEVITIENLRFKVTLKSNGIIELINLDNNKKHIFSSIQTQKITIGKSSLCSIAFPHSSLLSDIHLTMNFCSIKRQWMITDSSNDQTKHCWMLSDYPYTVYNGLICRIDSYSFKVEMGL